MNTKIDTKTDTQIRVKDVMKDWGISPAGLVSFVTAAFSCLIYLETKFSDLGKGNTKLRHDVQIMQIATTNQLNSLKARIDNSSLSRWTRSDMIEWSYEQQNFNKANGIELKMYPPQDIPKDKYGAERR